MAGAFPLRKIRLVLARGSGRGEVDRSDGYEFQAPLNATGRIDLEAFKHARKTCWVHRIRDGDVVQHGLLAHHPGGRGGATWSFDYSGATFPANETEEGFRLADRAFVVGEYVSIRDEDDGELKTYQVSQVSPA